MNLVWWKTLLKLLDFRSGQAVYMKNFHDSSDICPMGF